MNFEGFVGCALLISQDPVNKTLELSGHVSPGLPENHVMPKVLMGYLSHHAEQIIKDAAAWAVQEGIVEELTNENRS
jgi:hypothetical protein